MDPKERKALLIGNVYVYHLMVSQFMILDQDIPQDTRLLVLV